MQVPTPTATPHALSASVVGDIVGTDGNAYTTSAAYYGGAYHLPDGVTAAGVVVVKSETEGESYVVSLHNSATNVTWDNRANGLTEISQVTGKSWSVITAQQRNIIIPSEDSVAIGYISAAGGQISANANYWTDTEDTPNYAFYFKFNGYVSNRQKTKSASVLPIFTF